MFVLDSHCDTPSQIFRLRDVTKDNDHAHVDFPKLRKGGIDGVFFALYVPNSYEQEESERYADKLLECVDNCLDKAKEVAALALTPDQAYKNKEEGKISVFIGLENGQPIGESLDRLKYFYDRGVRYITLTHAGNNAICDSCAPEVKKWGGLSPFGRDVIAEMNRLGLIIDVSHISDDAFFDVLRNSYAPVVATHSCCRALANHPRNMTDEMIKALAEAGGVIQINFYPVFLDSSFAAELDAFGVIEKYEDVENDFINDPSDESKRKAWYDVLDKLEMLERPSYELIVDHIDHAVSIAGIDHVGLGSDFDGIAITPKGMEDISEFRKLFDVMRARGYSEEDIEKVAGLNFMRVFQDVIDCSSGE